MLVADPKLFLGLCFLLVGGRGKGVVSFCSTPFWVMENSDQGIDNKGTLGNGQGGEGFFELG